MERNCGNCKWFKLPWWHEPGDYSEEEMKNEETAPLGDCYYPYERLPFYLLKGLATREGMSVYPFEGTDCYTFDEKFARGPFPKALEELNAERTENEFLWENNFKSGNRRS